MPRKGIPMSVAHKAKMAAGRARKAAERTKAATKSMPEQSDQIDHLALLREILVELRAIRTLLERSPMHVDGMTLEPHPRACKEHGIADCRRCQAALAGEITQKVSIAYAAQRASLLRDEVAAAEPIDFALMAEELEEIDDPPLQASAEELRKIWVDRLRIYRGGKMWLPEWGPQPGQVGCQVPINMLRSHEIR